MYTWTHFWWLFNFADTVTVIFVKNHKNKSLKIDCFRLKDNQQKSK
jgi:hypothetical protein